MTQRSQGLRVVSIGTDSNLLALRQAVLELGGFEVSTTSSMPLAQALIKHRRCGVLLVCYSVPENWKKTLIQSFRESCPEGRIVGIVAGGLQGPSDDFDKVIFSTDKADAFLSWKPSAENAAVKRPGRHRPPHPDGMSVGEPTSLIQPCGELNEALLRNLAECSD